MISVVPIIELLFELRAEAQEEQERLVHEDNVGRKWMALEKYESTLLRAINVLKEVPVMVEIK
jgi:hypothetical protein